MNRQRKRKDIWGRTYTKFGYALHVTLTTLGIASFLLLIAFTCECDLGNITSQQWEVRALPCVTVFGASILLHNKIFEGR